MFFVGNLGLRSLALLRLSLFACATEVDFEKDCKCASPKGSV